MASSDAIMLDSPAQTPDPKGQLSTHATHVATEMSAGQPMVIDNEVSANAATGSWDTKKWREELQSVNGKLQHPHWNPGKQVDLDIVHSAEMRRAEANTMFCL